ncbi:MAG TPA: glycoside hydrolase family 3 C-terminal domain-containing protein [Propionibacteriaceae bacterium]|nr:glycoside hydrolase family 3 C-terminal domain-containing protein [Propionibacteriaceae bacterium]
MTLSSEAPVSIDAVIEQAVRDLGLDRKVTLLTGAAMFSLADEPAIGLHGLVFSDGPTGVRGAEFVGGRQVALLPNATVLAQTWDETAAQRVGELLAGEALAQGVHVVLGPTVNLHRSALGGRLFEAYSEDPLLSGRLAAAYLRGIQRYGVGGCVKHYVANESETDRHTVDSRVSQAALREVYLLPFEICVADAHPWTIMAAYNDVNGVAATEHGELNNGVLKGEWGWDGVLMSDWGATKTAAPAANGGLDLVMPGPRGPWGPALVAAVEAGELTEATIDDHLSRLLRLAGRVGAIDGIPADRTAQLDAAPAPDDPVVRDALRTMAAAGMVLLKGQQVLPLADSAITAESPVVVVGWHGLHTVLQGGGSAAVRPPHEISIAQGLTEALGVRRVRAVDGVGVRTNPPPASPDMVIDPQTGNPGVRIISYDAAGTEIGSTSAEVPELIVGMGTTVHEGAAEIELSARLTAPVGTPLLVGVRGAGEWTLSYGEDSDTFTVPPPAGPPEVGFMVPPSQTRVIAARPDQIIAIRVAVGGRFTLAGLVVELAPASDDDALAAAALAAQDAETAIVVVGLTAEQETEAVDKATLALPGRQDDLVRTVAAAARCTVVVVNAATPVLMPWLDEVDAVLVIGLPGQEGGYAVADVLLGLAEPSGRLVTTSPRVDGAGPAWSVTPVDGALDYAEGTQVGYRGWDGGEESPAFWFGEGLGWGRWAYDSATHTTRGAGERGEASETVTVLLANTAERPSREVVQVYWRSAEAGAPVRLVGYAIADEVVPGEQRRVAVACDPRAFRLWDETAGAWTTPPGGTLLVARGLGDVRLEITRR